MVHLHHIAYRISSQFLGPIAPILSEGNFNQEAQKLLPVLVVIFGE